MGKMEMWAKGLLFAETRNVQGEIGQKLGDFGAEENRLLYRENELLGIQN